MDLTLRNASRPGAASPAGASVIYTPALNFFGNDAFTRLKTVQRKRQLDVEKKTAEGAKAHG